MCLKSIQSLKTDYNVMVESQSSMCKIYMTRSLAKYIVIMPGKLYRTGLPDTGLSRSSMNRKEIATQNDKLMHPSTPTAHQTLESPLAFPRRKAASSPCPRIPREAGPQQWPWVSLSGMQIRYSWRSHGMDRPLARSQLENTAR